MKDSNDGTTEEECISGGGTWTAYNCGEAEEFLLNNPISNDPEVRQFLKEFWWQPKCCIGGADADADADDSTDTEADEMPSSGGNDSTDESRANIGAIVGGTVGGLAISAAVVALVIKKKRHLGAALGDKNSGGKRSTSIAATRRVTAYDFENTL